MYHCECCERETDSFDVRWEDADICFECSEELKKFDHETLAGKMGSLRDAWEKTWDEFKKSFYT